VDGIQGAGVLEADLENSGVGAFSAGGQKWLLSPYGTGVFYVRKGVPLETMFSGWLTRFDTSGNFSSLRKYNLPAPKDARAFELGTLPYHNLWAMYESAKLLAGLGIENIERHCISLARTFADEARRLGIKIVTPLEKRPSAIVSLKLSQPAKTHASLVERNIVCSHREKLLRFAFHIFNTHEDVERAIAALKGAR